MPRYVALLRGVSPMNAKMADLKSCFETLGFTDVKTVLSSGNVVFSSTLKSDKKLLAMIEAGMSADLPRSVGAGEVMSEAQVHQHQLRR